MTKWQCEDCGWQGEDSELLRAPNPFIEGDTMTACPGCRDTGTLNVCCDEPGCWRGAGCGWPTPSGGYRHTCFPHSHNMGTTMPEAA